MFPVDRSRRVELQGGVLQAVSEKVVSSTTFDVNSGDILSNNVETFRLSEPLNLATTAAAFVSDTTSLGPTSPIQGQRYRVEVSPTFGSVDFTNVLVDYRRYVMPVPFYTIAARVIHDGRYGSGAEDLRLHPLFINDPRLVRGYDIFDSSSVTCLVTYSGLCPSNDPFLGSRILVGNLELRFPLLRPFGASRGMYGPVPIEMALFGDAGVAWNRGERPALFGGSQPGISSAGAAFRFGLGFAVAEFDVVRPFQNATRGWTFGFNLIPGW
jgi:outer membrane protein assembly factor BamA